MDYQLELMEMYNALKADFFSSGRMTAQEHIFPMAELIRQQLPLVIMLPSVKTLIRLLLMWASMAALTNSEEDTKPIKMIRKKWRQNLYSVQESILKYLRIHTSEDLMDRVIVFHLLRKNLSAHRLVKSLEFIQMTACNQNPGGVQKRELTR